MENIKDLISRMTLEEKAGMCSGADFWHTKSVERLGIPSIMFSDGPHGLRKQEGESDHLGLNASIQAVCFPAGCAAAASFNTEMMEQLGDTVGIECQAENIGVVLGPAMNIKRSPLCGRNFEYYSEDPYVSGHMASAFIKGVQKHHIGTCPKHFAANNQENGRMVSSSDMDERTLHEIYLASFEHMVKDAKPWTIMNSYNRVNGTYMSEHRQLLTEVLRERWGFSGAVVTDWGANHDRVEGLRAGCDLEMPYSFGKTDAEIVKAVQDGVLEEAVLDNACENILKVVFDYVNNRENAVFDREADHRKAKEFAKECIVLLKNEDEILPVDKKRKVAFIGEFAANPRFQGGGSSHINSCKISSALDAVKDYMAGQETVLVYAQGYSAAAEKSDDTLVEEAVRAATEADTAVIFAGLPDRFESEGYDRKHLCLPENQNILIEAVAAVQPNVIVVLHNGSPVEMPWIGKVKGIVEAYLCGQAVGEAVVDVIYGETNPSGRLAETFPVRLEDTPCYLYYGGENNHSEYREGVFVGYRYYLSKKLPVLFPFGYGLSYTEFRYSDLQIEKTEVLDTEQVKVRVNVANVGSRAGKEVVQLYVEPVGGSVIRPLRELRSFAKVELQAGEVRTVEFMLDKMAFSYWNQETHGWSVPAGKYLIQFGKNCGDIVLSGEIHVKNAVMPKKVFTVDSTLGEIMADPNGSVILGGLMAGMAQEGKGGAENKQIEEDEAITAEMQEAMGFGMPLRQLMSFLPDITKEMVEQLLAALNG